LTLCGLAIVPSPGKAQPRTVDHDRMGYQFLSPLPGAEYVTKYTRIILRPGEPLDPSRGADASWISVIGFKTGLHHGKVYFADDNKTVVFTPDVPFEPSDTVTVRVGKGLRTKAGDDVVPIEYTFIVSPKTKPIVKPEETWYKNFYLNYTVSTTKRLPDASKSGKVSLPTDFPSLTITERHNPSDGYLFFAPFIFPDPKSSMAYMIIMDNDGKVVFYQRDYNPYGNFQKLWNGNLTYYWYATKTHYIMDPTYSIIDSFNAVGYDTDGHEFLYLQNGHALLITYDRQRIDMSQIVPGGNKYAIVEGFIIQEIEPNREVVFEWRSWDHFKITDATDSVDLTGHYVDYAHCNSIDVDTDGNLLISCRNLDECTKISRTTGDIVWRLGGKLCENNEFTFIGDKLEGFTFQHDFRRVGDDYMLFDNANNHLPPIPRAVEYRIDEAAKTATLVWEYPYRNAVDDSHMGSIQRLEDGNTLINWGGSFLGDNGIRISEITPDNDVAFELDFGRNRYKTYRICRDDWQGQAKVPYLVVEQNPDAKVLILTYNVFGDADFSGYNIYHGYQPQPTDVLVSTIDNQMELGDLTNGDHYFRVTALDSNYQETGFSNEVKINVSWSRKKVTEFPKPKKFSLSQNTPNPFSSTTAVSYSLPEEIDVRIAVFDVNGELVEVLHQGVQLAGSYTLTWNASDAKPGTYYCRMDSKRYSAKKKMILTR
jgi:hypothetical protein